MTTGHLKRGKDFWRTPDRILADVFDAFGGTLFDVCPSPDRDHWTPGVLTWADAPDHDALTEVWPAGAFCNPPYSQTKKWVPYAFKNCSDFLFLIPPSVGTRYWHEHCLPQANALAWYNGRIAFLDDEGTPAKGNPLGSCLVGKLAILKHFENLPSQRWFVERG